MTNKTRTAHEEHGSTLAGELTGDQLAALLSEKQETRDGVNWVITSGGIEEKETIFKTDTIHGTHKEEKGLGGKDFRKITGYVFVDEGLNNTGSCTSTIAYVDGDRTKEEGGGRLHYCGIPAKQLAEKSDFAETGWLLNKGELPTEKELDGFRKALTDNELVHEDLQIYLDSWPKDANPMDIFSGALKWIGAHEPGLFEHNNEDDFMLMLAKIMSKVRTIAAHAYNKSVGVLKNYPKPEMSYCENFLHMMFSKPNIDWKKSIGEEKSKIAVRALEEVLVLHADHEQNCGTATVRLVASSEASLFSSIASGVSALSGELHGGANVAVINQLEEIHGVEVRVIALLKKAQGSTNDEVIKLVEEAKDAEVAKLVERAQGSTNDEVIKLVEEAKDVEVNKLIKRAEDSDDPFRLMGFGHAVYKTEDPRATVLKKVAEELLEELGIDDPLLDIAKKLEAGATSSEILSGKNLYPNVDFYSGIILRALGIPKEMFPVIFAMGRMPGWIAHWKEQRSGPRKIGRPRQIYTGEEERNYVEMDDR